MFGFSKGKNAALATEELNRPMLKGMVKVTETGAMQDADSYLLVLVREGWDLRNQKEISQKALEKINATLLEGVGVGHSVTLEGVCSVTLTERVTVKIKDSDRLKDLLGPRWEDLVAVSVTYRPTDRLLEIASDADHPLHEAISGCLLAETSTAVTYRPVRQ